MKIKLKNNKFGQNDMYLESNLCYKNETYVVYKAFKHVYFIDNHKSIMISYHAKLTSYFKNVRRYWIRNLGFLNCSEMLENHQI